MDRLIFVGSKARLIFGIFHLEARGKWGDRLVLCGGSGKAAFFCLWWHVFVLAPSKRPSLIAADATVYCVS